ncbi:MAG: hypothetical protein IJI48_00770, partial [Ruminococcus sp.]|nr:hypothetical protein [Ruminococcus sp.]
GISDINGRIYHGNEGISDVNGRMGFRGWNCMFISRDLNVGSPIIVNKGEDAFFVKHGDDGTNPINGYDCVKAFGEIMPVNLNSLMKKDEYGGIYVHYRTEKSILNNSGSSDPDAGGVSGTGTDVGNDDTGSSDTVDPNLYYEDIKDVGVQLDFDKATCVMHHDGKTLDTEPKEMSGKDFAKRSYKPYEFYILTVD